MPVLRWSPTTWRRMEALRDRIMHGVGTDEEYVMENHAEFLGERAVAVSWRRPLRIDEINRMAPTPEVRERKGRP